MKSKKNPSGAQKPIVSGLSDVAALSVPLGIGRAPRDFDWLVKNIPCQAACPAGTDIPGYLEAIAKGQHAEAYRINLRDNVFPAVLGRVCTRPCEPACRHGWEGLGEPVAICFSKRSAEAFMENHEPVKLPALFPATGKKVAIVGAGAAGLAAGRDLALMGHQVNVYEKHSQPGGLMLLGIPPFRLPRDLLAREIEQVRLTGVTILCGTEVGRDISLEELHASHDVVILSAGTLKPYLPDLPGVELKGVLHGLPFLMGIHVNGKPTTLDGEAVVIGGGFTAVDCARTAQRLGASKVSVYYRRSEAEMYITPGEVEAMKEEGIDFVPLAAPVAFLGEGEVERVQFVRTTLGEADASGRSQALPVEGSEFDVLAKHVFLATGQVPDSTWVDDAYQKILFNEQGELDPEKDHETEDEKIFVAGDFAHGADSLIDAIGHARACARKVDAYLMGEERLRDVVRVEDATTTGRTREMDEWPREPMPTLNLSERNLDAEVDTGLDAEAAEREAGRCYLCHYKFEIDNDLCIYCDRCLKVMPVAGCIAKVSALEHDREGRIAGYQASTSSRDYNLLFIDQAECIRCGACAEVCPVECITLQKVTLEVQPTDALNNALSTS